MVAHLSYNPGLVLLSALVAMSGAYVAIEIAQRVREASGRRRTYWLGGGAIAMGLGIWSMHFIAMLALKLAEPVRYDAFVTLLSMVAAVAGSAIAFAIFDRSRVKPGVVGVASIFMGVAIAGMHYTGMAAMRMPGQVRYDSLLVAASVAVAIAVSYVALIVTRRLITSRRRASRMTLLMIGAAMLMGLAVVSMHYTGMAAATFLPGGLSRPPEGGLLLGGRNLGLAVAMSSFALLALALAGTQLERRYVIAAARFQSFVELSPQIVWSANSAGQVTDFNQYWYYFTGLPADRPIDQTWAAAIHGDDRDRVVADWLASIQSGKTLDSEFRLRRADGVYHTFIAKGRPVLGERGETLRWLGIAIDIEDRKIAERALQETTQELLRQTEEAQAANQSKSDFLASMSHELRTPLNAIGGYAELLEMGLRGPVTPQQREDLGKIKRSQQHLLGLINDVLNFAKIDAGQIEYRFAEVVVDAMVRDTESMIGPQLRLKGLSYKFEGCKGIGVVRADRDKLQQILLNLLGNALKFTDSGGEVCVSCDGDAERLRIQVKDSGIGISDDKLERIFDPFVQVDQQLNQMSQGVGLGLSISRDLARAMAGDLTVVSRLGEGSTFTLTLPRAKAP